MREWTRSAGARFEELAHEWRALRGSVTSDVTSWERDVAELRREQDRLRAEGAWMHGRDDLLGVLGLHRDEVRHSRAIAWLLDPAARHGLGARVLEELLAVASPGEVFDAAALAAARPRCEVPLLDGRLDIVVESPAFYLVIENKVDAPEGPGQCEYYFRNIARPDARFILLSPDGREAKTDDNEVRAAFRPLRYSTLAEIIESALRACAHPARGRAAAEEYLRTLRKEFCR